MADWNSGGRGRTRMTPVEGGANGVVPTSNNNNYTGNTVVGEHMEKTTFETIPQCFVYSSWPKYRGPLRRHLCYNGVGLLGIRTCRIHGGF